MADVVAAEVRSRMMSRIGGKDTGPELLVRRALHRRGFRYQLHVKHLPGKPDIVMPRHKAIIFIHGCFWHGHDCYLFKWPSSNVEFWRNKITRNRIVDRDSELQLLAAGWRVLTVWECALKGKMRQSMEVVLEDIVNWIQSDHPKGEIRGK